MQLINGAKFLNFIFLLALFVLESAAVVFGIVIVSLTSIYASL